MGASLDSCCKGGNAPETSGEQLSINVSKSAGVEAPDAERKPKKQLQIRRTVQTEEIELTAEEMAARCGAEDPDIDKLKSESAERQAAAAAGDAPMAPKRAKDRKGTSAPTRIPVVDEVESDEVGSAVPAGMQKRSKDRKGTGFVKAEMMPIEDDEDEDE